MCQRRQGYYKMSELRRLTWKYFFKQKWKEIKNAFPLILAISLIGSMVLIFLGFVPMIKRGEPLCPILGFIGAGIIVVWILIGIVMLIKSICKWIKSNWIMASERAERELNPPSLVDLGE